MLGRRNDVGDLSVRGTTQHRWDPKMQRPELWRLSNARKNKGESIRVLPLSNWTELDIWQYIYLENISIVPITSVRLNGVQFSGEPILARPAGGFCLVPI